MVITGRSQSVLSASKAPTPQQNHLLAALPADAQDRIFPYLKRIPLPLGKVLYESGGICARFIFLPTPLSRCFT